MCVTGDGEDRIKSHPLTQRREENPPSLYPPSFSAWGLRIKLIKGKLTRGKKSVIMYTRTETRQDSVAQRGNQNLLLLFRLNPCLLLGRWILYH